MYSVYMHTCPNGKKYIGLTRRTLKKRFRGGKGYERNPEFFADILKYGWDNIEHVILFESTSKAESEAKEAEMIKLYNTTDERYGYNLRKGGSRYGFNNTAINKMSFAHIGKRLPEEQKAKISAALKGRKTSRGTLGYTYSIESRQKMSISQKEAYKKREIKLFENKNPRAHGVINLTTGKKYDTIRAAQIDCGIKTHASICHACTGKTETAGGYKWAYIQEA